MFIRGIFIFAAIAAAFAAPALSQNVGQQTATPAASPLVGYWCMERPRELAYGSKVGLVISEVNDAGFTGQYNWEGTGPLNTKVTATFAGDKAEFWVNPNVWYKVGRTLDAKGRISGKGGNNRLNSDWSAVFTKTSKTKVSTDKDGNQVTVPDCPVN